MNTNEFASLTTLKVTIDSNKVAHIQLARPEQLNAMNMAFWAELPSVIAALDREAAARVVVISSTGKHFTAGMDLDVFRNMGASYTGEPARRAEGLRRWVMHLQDSFNALENARMPVLTAIQGGCIGGGVDMVCASDMRYCSRDAFFSIRETALGMAADVGTLQRVQHVMPVGLARELAYTSRNMDASEALSCGFVNQVFDSQEQLLEEVMAIAASIAKHSPIAVSGTKTMLNYSRDHSVAESLEAMATWQSGMLQMPDVQEAMQATAEKRDGQFEDLLPFDSSMK